MDRTVNDDYFPQGDEYEHEIGKDDNHRHRNSKRDHDDDIEPTTQISLQHQSNNQMQIIKNEQIFYKVTNLFAKEINENDTFDRLKTLVKKAVDFKRRVFQTKTEDDQTFDSSKNDETKSDSNGHDKLVPIF